MKKKIARWWTKKTSVEKSVTILTFIVLIVIIQVLTLSARLSETISLLLQVAKADAASGLSTVVICGFF